MEKKQCTRCQEGKDLNCFGNRKDTKDGLAYECKDCKKRRDKKYYEKKKPEISIKNKVYRKKNSKKIKKYQEKYRKSHKKESKEYNKEYRENNKDNIYERSKKRLYSPIKFDSKTKMRQEIEVYEKEIRESDEGYLQCKCAYCGVGFNPIFLSIKSRIDSINGTGNARGECRLYCSDPCKYACPTYHQFSYPKGFKPATSREVQPELRQMVLLRDNYTCQRCNKHKDELDVALHCHHLEGIHGEPLMSADMNMCITYCQPCHVKAHQTPGCGYNDMQCNDIGRIN